MNPQEFLNSLPNVECSCKRCRQMCHRPCFGTPEDIEKLIENGYGDRLTLDSHCGLEEDAMIDLLTPALKGREGLGYCLNPSSEAGCTFWRYGKCTLHSSGLKPTGGKKDWHDGPDSSPHVAELWKSEKGRSMVEEFKKRHQIKDKNWVEWARSLPINENIKKEIKLLLSLK